MKSYTTCTSSRAVQSSFNSVPQSCRSRRRQEATDGNWSVLSSRLLASHRPTLLQSLPLNASPGPGHCSGASHSLSAPPFQGPGNGTIRRNLPASLHAGSAQSLSSMRGKRAFCAIPKALPIELHQSLRRSIVPPRGWQGAQRGLRGESLSVPWTAIVTFQGIFNIW